MRSAVAEVVSAEERMRLPEQTQVAPGPSSPHHDRTRGDAVTTQSATAEIRRAAALLRDA